MSVTAPPPVRQEEATQVEPRPSWLASSRFLPRRFVRPTMQLLYSDAAAGILLLLAAVAALIWVNSPVGESYEALLHAELGFAVGSFELVEPLHAWINDLLMAVFFFVVGMEIKHEATHGHLRDPRAAAVPAIAALGGMVVPAALYLVFAAGTAASGGWGIPMATDIAFVVGVLALLGEKAPPGLRVYMLTLAIVDDIGAIIVIALFYSDGLSLGWLGLSAAVIALIWFLQRLDVRHVVPYVALAGVLWLAVFESGVHATIAGVVLGLLTPAHSPHPLAAVKRRTIALMQRVGTEGHAVDEHALREASRLTNHGTSQLDRAVTVFQPWTSLLILPLFALANAGVHLSGDVLREAVSSPAALGTVVGLVVGKPLGIVLATLLAVRLGGLRLPEGVSWRAVVGGSCLAGIGFTVSIFVAGLAFGDGPVQEAAKIGILSASVAAGVIGAVVLRGASSSSKA